MGKETYQITEYVHDQVIAYCRDATKEAMPILYKVQKGEDPSRKWLRFNCYLWAMVRKYY